HGIYIPRQVRSGFRLRTPGFAPLGGTPATRLNSGAQGRIRTSVPRKEEQIYSLPALTTHPPVRNTSLGLSCGLRQHHTRAQHYPSVPFLMSGTIQKFTITAPHVQAGVELSPKIAWREASGSPEWYHGDFRGLLQSELLTGAAVLHAHTTQVPRHYCRNCSR